MFIRQTYDELISLAAEGDFRNVCTVAHNEQSSEVEGVYNVLPDNTILHCFSQGANKNLGKNIFITIFHTFHHETYIGISPYRTLAVF